MSEMKTLNGYEVVDAKAREDIALLQESSGTGGAKVISLPVYPSDMNDEQKAALEHLFSYMTANGKPCEDYVFYVRGGNNRYIVATDIQLGDNYLFIRGVLDGDIYNTMYVFTDGAVTRGSQSWQDKQPPKWIKVNESGSAFNLSSNSSYSLFKLVGYWFDEPSYLATYEIAFPQAASETSDGYRFLISDPFRNSFDAGATYFEWTSGELRLINSVTNFAPVCYYYWTGDTQ